MKEPSMKGYAVRGKCDGRDVYSYGPSDGFGEGCPEISPRCIWDLDTAAGARAFMVRRGCTDVRVYAVAEDGGETPLPTYEEALETLEKLRLAFEYPNTRELWAELRIKVGAS